MGTERDGSGGDGARRGALRLLNGVVAERLAMTDLLARPEMRALPAPERARAQRLALAVLRNLARADAILKPYLRKAPPDAVVMILRLATVELLAEGAAAHGVVHAAVGLARAEGRQGDQFSALVNAVLRRVAETAPETWAALPPPPMAPWLRRRLVAAWGKGAVQAMEAVQAGVPPTDVTPRDGDAAGLAERVGGTALPTGSVRLPAGAQISALPGYDTGDWWVQDAAAALAARVLHPALGERIADLCAAPGGKTLQLAAAGAAVTAIDQSPERLVRVAENLARCGLVAEVVAADVRTWQGGPFDAVLLDAPCSATGTIRRHPELPMIRDGAGLAAIAALQAELLDRAIALTAPGGRIVYCTCSLLPDEGEGQIAAALARHPDLRLDPQALDVPGVASAWRAIDGGLRIRPDFWAETGGIDGFFIAALRRD